MSDELIALVQQGRLDAVTASLDGEGGRYLNSCGSSGEAPIHAAIKSKNLLIADLLVKRGANVNLPAEDPGSAKGYTAAHFAARAGDVDAIKFLAAQHADFNREAADGWTPLHAATFAGKRLAAVALLDKKADLNQRNVHGLTPIVFAVSHGRLQDIRELLDRGATLDLHDVHGDSLLHHCFHFQMQKLFEGEYDMPPCQVDVAVILAIAGAPLEQRNNEGKTAFEYVAEDIPSLKSVLAIVTHNAEKFRASKTDWNYMTLLSARVEHFLGMGLEMKHAMDLYENLKKAEQERLKAKEEREAARPAGGCPVMRGNRKKKGDGGAAAPTIPADGSDPSGGQCPFFNKKADGETPAPPAKATVPAHGDLKIPADGSDPSEGKCPFFQKKSAASPPTAVHTTVQREVPPKAIDGVPWYGTTTNLMMMLICFFCGIWFEQMSAAVRHRLAAGP